MNVSISSRGIEHAISSFGKSTSRSAHFDVLAALPDMLKHAVVVESYQDVKGKKNVKFVHRIFAAADIKGKKYAVKMTVLERSDGTKNVDFGDHFEFYDYHLPKEVLTSGQAAAPDVSNPSTFSPTTTADMPGTRNMLESAVTLRDLLSGLNDDDRNPYFQRHTGSNARGSVTFADSGPIIRFFQSRNASTAIHELSHVWLEELRSDAAGPDAPQQLRDDWITARRHLGLNDLAEDVAIPTEAHETFARTGEAYFREGRAPSAELIRVFQQFRDWLLQIYRSIRQLNVQMTPEIREVFDRLLATDDEIKAMRPDKASSTPAGVQPPVDGSSP